MTSALNSVTGTDKRSTATSGAITAVKAKAARSLVQPGLRPVTPVRLAGLYGHNPRQNNLLAGLSSADYERILPHLEFVSMPFGMTVCESDTAMQHAYFLTSSIVSLMYETRDGASSETAVVGNEGVVGVALFMGGGNSLNRAIVKSAGYGFRLKASILKEEFSRGGRFQQMLLRYTQALLTQMSQTAVCNRHHSVVQQLCRWLLLSLDRDRKSVV